MPSRADGRGGVDVGRRRGTEHSGKVEEVKRRARLVQLQQAGPAATREEWASHDVFRAVVDTAAVAIAGLDRSSRVIIWNGMRGK